MTAPAVTRRWSRWVYAVFSEGPEKPPVVGSMFSVHQPHFTRERSQAPRPKTTPPNLPTGAKVLEGDTLLQFTRAKDEDIQPNEIVAARDWLAWRWDPKWKPRPEEM